jgi:hypothetical protein
MGEENNHSSTTKESRFLVTRHDDSMTTKGQNGNKRECGVTYGQDPNIPLLARFFCVVK